MIKKLSGKKKQPNPNPKSNSLANYSVMYTAIIGPAKSSVMYQIVSLLIYFTRIIYF